MYVLFASGDEWKEVYKDNTAAEIKLLHVPTTISTINYSLGWKRLGFVVVIIIDFGVIGKLPDV